MNLTLSNINGLYSELSREYVDLAEKYLNLSESCTETIDSLKSLTLIGIVAAGVLGFYLCKTINGFQHDHRDTLRYYGTELFTLREENRRLKNALARIPAVSEGARVLDEAFRVQQRGEELGIPLSLEMVKSTRN